MNEAADAGGNLGTVVLLTFYWIVVVMWDVLFTPRSPGKPPRAGAPEHVGQTASKPGSGRREAADILRRSERSFDEAAFLRGASRAYETIVHAYAKGDAATLEPLVAQAVLDVFVREAAARRDRRETLELTLVGLREAKIVDADVTGNSVAVSVHFVAELVKVSRSAGGEIVDGDPQRILVTEDLWTFVGDLKSAAPTWLLTATDGC